MIDTMLVKSGFAYISKWIFSLHLWHNRY